MKQQVCLEVSGIDKSFFGVPVLKSVDFRVTAGHAIGLVGENGAGKSTLMNIIGGLFSADAGAMRLDGELYAPRSCSDARTRGVEMVHQELNLFENLTILENMQLAHGSARNRGELRRQVSDALVRVGLDVAPNQKLTQLSPGERQLVEIAKAIRLSPKVLLLDEPTTSLTEPEAEKLFDIIEKLKQHGTAIVYISHNLNHVRQICDHLVVLRDGQIQTSEAADGISLERIISLMVGRDIQKIYPRRNGSPAESVVLEVKHLTKLGMINDVSFQLRAGEVLGLSGLMGSGRTELVRLLFGREPSIVGEILVEGRPLRPSPRRCIDRGMAFVTESRREDGLLLESSVAENSVLASLSRFSVTPLGWFSRRRALEATSRMAERLSVRCQSQTAQPVLTLSGGNQQKVVLAKWLLTEPRVVILDEPTRGIDIGARRDIYERINELARSGAGVLLISSELEELVGMCDRILVMTSGEIRSEMRREQFDRHNLLRAAFGEERLG